jgi:transcriptional regulator with XRE-family HTH domain
MPARSIPRYHRFGQNLQTQRTRTKWTQEKLAERLKISWRYYQSLEAGSRAPSFELLLRIVKVLGCSWSDLMWEAEK